MKYWFPESLHISTFVIVIILTAEGSTVPGITPQKSTQIDSIAE